MPSTYQLSVQNINTLKTLFAQADALIFSAGAGMGVDSGLPDFRGNTGMWQAYPELGKQKINFTSIANPHAFKKDPYLAWGFYGHRLALYRKTQPHQGFHLLKKIAEQQDLPYFIFTSNVDGQFQKAGFDDQFIYECHGSIHHLQCTLPCSSEIWSAAALSPDIEATRCQWQGELPTCPSCGSLARPNILMFDDMKWQSYRQDQQRQRLEQWMKSFRRIMVIEIGAGTAVPTVRYFSEQFSPRLIRINPREHSLYTKGGLSLPTTAQRGIELIYQALNQQHSKAD